MAQTARNNEAEKATDNVAELGKRAADKGADVAREAIDRTEDTARRGFEYAQRTAGAALEVERAVARRSAEGATEISQAFAELVKEQARHNVESSRRCRGPSTGTASPRSRATSCAPAWSGRRSSPGATSRWCRR